MKAPDSTSSRYWILVLALAAILVVAAFAYWAKDILSPFVVAFILAYAANPLVIWLEKFGLARHWAALATTVVMILIFVSVLVLLGPVIYEQFVSLLKALPGAFEKLLTGIRWKVLPFIPEPFHSRFKDVVMPSAGEFTNLAGPLMGSLISGGAAVLIWLGLAILTPVILYYLLNEWPSMMRGFLTLFPADKQEAVGGITDSIDGVMSGFLRGQAWVCLTMAVFYSTGLMIAGLEYGLLIGVLSGLLKYLPYIGTAVGVILALTAGLTQGDPSLYLMIGIGLTYGLGEILESSFLTPNLVGTRVLLSPAVVIFAVLLGGKLFGILGVFVAAPVFAAGRILLHYILFQEVPAAKDHKPLFKQLPRKKV